MIYHRLRQDLSEIIGRLCQYKGVKIIEGYLIADRAFVTYDTTNNECIKLYGIPKRKKYDDAI